MNMYICIFIYISDPHTAPAGIAGERVTRVGQVGGGQPQGPRHAQHARGEPLRL